jgi:serine/threonine-protein kinase RsbT
MEIDDMTRKLDEGLRIDVHSEADISNMRWKVTAFLSERCSPEEQAEVITVMLELASNALHYAGSGSLSMQICDDILRITCEDQGPGILEWDTKKYESMDHNKTLGIGLGVVCRLMDAVDIHTEAGCGTNVVASRRLGVRKGPPPMSAEEAKWINWKPVGNTGKLS